MAGFLYHSKNLLISAELKLHLVSPINQIFNESKDDAVKVSSFVSRLILNRCLLHVLRDIGISVLLLSKLGTSRGGAVHSLVRRGGFLRVVMCPSVV